MGGRLRIVSANLLHSLALFPTHIIVNSILILGFALLVERPLGPLRTLVVMALAGVGAMAASSLAGYSEVIGASGLAAGLVGAELALELHFAERLPASWRLSRPLFLAVLLLDPFPATTFFGFLPGPESIERSSSVTS